MCHWCHRRLRLVCWTWYDGRILTQSSRFAVVTLSINGSNAFFTQLLNSFNPARSVGEWSTDDPGITRPSYPHTREVSFYQSWLLRDDAVHSDMQARLHADIEGEFRRSPVLGRGAAISEMTRRLSRAHVGSAPSSLGCIRSGMRAGLTFALGILNGF